METEQQTNIIKLFMFPILQMMEAQRLATMAVAMAQAGYSEDVYANLAKSAEASRTALTAFEDVVNKL